MNIIRTPKTLSQRGWLADAALVPTMGALHEGHISLVRTAQKAGYPVVVSIFVNPAQFGPNEDFTRYPRTEEKDLALLAQEGVEAVYIPQVEDMYPAGYATQVQVDESLTGILCGAQRPGHFSGVATVLTKLFNQLRPKAAFFGEKDYQQLTIIRRLVQDLDFNIMVEAGTTVREEDGLALSSRNRYLSPEQRRIAPLLYQTLTQMRTALHESQSLGEEAIEELRQKTLQSLEKNFDGVDYVELRHAGTLEAVKQWKSGIPVRLFAAAWLDRTRLIDNIAL